MKMSKSSNEQCDLPGYYYDSIKKRYFKINGTERQNRTTVQQSPGDSSCSSVSPRRGQSSFVNVSRLVRSRECGQFLQPGSSSSQWSSFPQQVTRSKFGRPRVQRLQSVRSSFGLDCRRPISCLSLLTGKDSKYLVGIWNYEGGLHAEQFVAAYEICKAHDRDEEDLACRLVPVAFPVPVRHSPITGSCWVRGDCAGCTVLICTVDDIVSECTIVALYDGAPHNMANICLENDAMFSCTFNEVRNVAAFGMETYGLMCPMHTDSRKYVRLVSEHESIFSIQLHSSGQTGLGGTRKGHIYCWDIRDRPSGKYQFKLKVSNLAVGHLGILENDRSVICSSFGDQLQLFDLRNRKSILRYEGHVNSHLKIPFSVDESLGVLCSPGQDGCIRLWDIRSGGLLKALVSTIDSETDCPKVVFRPPFCGKSTLPTIFSCSGNRLTTYTFK